MTQEANTTIGQSPTNFQPMYLPLLRQKMDLDHTRDLDLDHDHSHDPDLDHSRDPDLDPTQNRDLDQNQNRHLILYEFFNSLYLLFILH